MNGLVGACAGRTIQSDDTHKITPVLVLWPETRWPGATPGGGTVAGGGVFYLEAFIES